MTAALPVPPDRQTLRTTENPMSVGAARMSARNTTTPSSTTSSVGVFAESVFTKAVPVQEQVRTLPGRQPREPVDDEPESSCATMDSPILSVGISFATIWKTVTSARNGRNRDPSSAGKGSRRATHVNGGCDEDVWSTGWLASISPGR